MESTKCLLMLSEIAAISSAIDPELSITKMMSTGLEVDTSVAFDVMHCFMLSESVSRLRTSSPDPDDLGSMLEDAEQAKYGAINKKNIKLAVNVLRSMLHLSFDMIIHIVVLTYFTA